MKRKEIILSPADKAEVMKVIEKPGTDVDLSGCLNVLFTIDDYEEDSCNSELSVAFSKEGAKNMIELLQEFVYGKSVKVEVEGILEEAEKLYDECIDPDEFNYIAGQRYAYETVLGIIEGETK
ncbi:hypothetical protein BigBertha_108 [Bacillus phage BigBertha]|uniref:Uncharacterized protein n=1 Tax=Bacillus phage BigBertha TaxID=1406781 RepID=U5PSC6_9CAUD|nr:hypothetical protein BigBertha_108 [Bacillus phage BigBertha]AGY46616.1 hypothetical protein BigBertha_108 [Bacillus phage BigBertha]